MSTSPVTHARAWLATGIASLAVYVLLAVTVFERYTHAPLPGLDMPVIEFAYHHRAGFETHVASFDAFMFGDTSGAILGLCVAVLIALLLRDRAGGIWMLASILVVVVINTIVKMVVGRARPTIHRLPAFAHESGNSFSSGHSAFTTVLFGCLALILLQVIHRRLGRAVLVTVCAVMVLTVMYSRIYIGVHYPSDTVGGFLLATSWLAFTYPVYVSRRDQVNDAAFLRSPNP
ncbi:MAG: phosphatase PAP2 family protein [Cellulomonadaceae bacterium]|jgi:undecaprenyl-diphosphatase|nr:phosphatase PAP2 family protein [Cellulomonadaceae bacterium]